MGNLAKLINSNIRQTDLTTSTTHNSPLRSIIQTLRDRNIEFLKVAKTWTTEHIMHGSDTTPETNSTSILSPNNLDNNTSHLWRNSYFDEDSLRPILKVNSHQLDDTGSHIKDPPRYEKLIPNFCLLYANHIADTIADFPFHNTNWKVTHNCNTILHPMTPLRFSLSMNGKTLDKHVNEAIRNTIFKERLKRIRSKAFQGLLWRIIDDTSELGHHFNHTKVFSDH